MFQGCHGREHLYFMEKAESHTMPGHGMACWDLLIALPLLSASIDKATTS